MYRHMHIHTYILAITVKRRIATLKLQSGLFQDRNIHRIFRPESIFCLTKSLNRHGFPFFQTKFVVAMLVVSVCFYSEHARAHIHTHTHPHKGLDRKMSGHHAAYVIQRVTS